MIVVSVPIIIPTSHRYTTLPIPIEALSRQQKEQITRHTSTASSSVVFITVAVDAVACYLALDALRGVGAKDKSVVTCPCVASRLGPRGIVGQ